MSNKTANCDGEGIIKQINDALKEPIPDTYTANQVQQMIREAHQAGFREGATQTSQIITHAEPYEITTKVGAEVDSKGYTKPSAEVKITRFLEKGSEITELIHADISRGVEECMVAINEVHKRVNKS